MGNKIHPTAIVSPEAELGNNLIIEPYAVISDDVQIGDDCYIGHNAVIYDGARIGDRVKIYQSAVVSNIPQDLKFNNERTLFYIGDDTVIREFVTLHRGTEETGYSKVGKNCLIMAYCHVAHDVIVGDKCIIANGVQIAGHVKIEDWAIIGGMTVVHQFNNVGQHSMTGGGFRILKDVPPYVLAGNEPLRYSGLNLVGLRRRGFSKEDLADLKKAYATLYDTGLNFSQAVEKLESEFSNHSLIKNIIKFFKNSSRGVIRK
jgi:UDP-N-acetylglucosamine acyltransferase